MEEERLEKIWGEEFISDDPDNPWIDRIRMYESLFNKTKDKQYDLLRRECHIPTGILEKLNSVGYLNEFVIDLAKNHLSYCDGCKSNYDKFVSLN